MRNKTMSNHLLSHTETSEPKKSQGLHSHSLTSKIRYTDAVKELLQKYNAFWLLDEIIFFQSFEELSSEPVQIWKVEGFPSRSGRLLCEGEDGFRFLNKILFSTDFPLSCCTFLLKKDVLHLEEES